jgi:DNA mismatch repair protein MutL
MAVDLPSEVKSDQALQDCIDRIAARLACHGSIRSGQDLRREEVYALFEALDSTQFAAACPHGRPVVVEFKRSDVERWFGRDK